jgi:hypothetical protein
VITIFTVIEDPPVWEVDGECMFSQLALSLLKERLEFKRLRAKGKV